MIGVICSGGGSAVIAAHQFSRNQGREFHVITDRPCGIETFCRDAGVKWERIAERDNNAFSERAAEAFRSSGAMTVLLYFDRLVGMSLTSHWTCVNFHPSLLPAYAGFRAIERAINDRVRFLGHTCHIANHNVDAGPILAQSAYPLGAEDYSVARALDISFVQKLALTILLISHVDQKLKPQRFMQMWNGLRPTGPNDFVNPNALTPDGNAIVLKHAAMRNMHIYFEKECSTEKSSPAPDHGE